MRTAKSSSCTDTLSAPARQRRSEGEVVGACARVAHDGAQRRREHGQHRLSRARSRGSRACRLS